MRLLSLICIGTLGSSQAFILPSPVPSLLCHHKRSSLPTSSSRLIIPPSSPSSVSSLSPLVRQAVRSKEEGAEGGSSVSRFGPRTFITAAAWLAFVGYAFLLAPGNSETAKALDADLLKAIVANPFSDGISPIFVAIFNALGIMPFVYSCLLLPGSKSQSPPAVPFCIVSFALGFFAIGPYLALRRYMPTPALPERKWLAGAIENKILAIGTFLSSLALVYYALAGGPSGADLGQRIAGYMSIFTSQMFVHVSSLDLLILSIFILDPMREDMVRRDWYSPTKLAAFALPVIGPSLYLVLRPKLSPAGEEEGEW